MRPVCALQPIPIRAFTPHGQIMSKFWGPVLNPLTNSNIPPCTQAIGAMRSSQAPVKHFAEMNEKGRLRALRWRSAPSLFSPARCMVCICHCSYRLG